jgi:hypothetical protein
MSDTSRRGRPRGRAVLAALMVGTLSATAALLTAPAASAAESTVGDAVLTWGMNGESGGGAFAGGCNWLSAGTAGNAGGSHAWTESEAATLGGVAATAGNVKAEKPTASGGFEPLSWANRCKAADGTSVSASNPAKNSGVRVVVSNGTGKVDAAAGTGSISWTGSWSVVFYGGYTYWTVSDPKLTVTADGKGTLTATASGYGADMNDTSQWNTLPARQITLANLTGVQLSATGFSVTPDYRGVSVTTTGTPQSTSGANWGSFPQSFVDYQTLTGQSSYWYSSGGSRDAAKPATALTVGYTAQQEPTEPTEPEQPATDDSQDLQVTVPQAPVEPSGSIAWHILGDERLVDLGTATKNTDGTFSATGALHPVEVQDDRSPDNPGWSVSASVTDFTNGSNTAPASSLGWSPKVVKAGGGATAGAAVTAFGSSEVLGSAPAGHDISSNAQLGADLSLKLPAGSAAGTYSAKLTLTLVG